VRAGGIDALGCRYGHGPARPARLPRPARRTPSPMTPPPRRRPRSALVG